MPKPVNLDGSLTSADWTKRSWDITDWNHEPVLTVDAFLGYLGLPPDVPLTEAQRRVAAFMQLPASGAMPDVLRSALIGRGIL